MNFLEISGILFWILVVIGTVGVIMIMRDFEYEEEQEEKLYEKQTK